MSISKLVENFSRFDYNRIVDECFSETKEVLFNLIRSQLADGRKADGDMPDYQSVYYARKKGSQRVNLKLTGAFLNALILIQNKYSVRVRSSDKKSPKLLRTYGASVMELTPENYSNYVRNTILPLFQIKIKNELLSKNE